MLLLNADDAPALTPATQSRFAHRDSTADAGGLAVLGHAWPRWAGARKYDAGDAMTSHACPGSFYAVPSTQTRHRQAQDTWHSF